MSSPKDTVILPLHTFALLAGRKPGYLRAEALIGLKPPPPGLEYVMILDQVAVRLLEEAVQIEPISTASTPLPTDVSASLVARSSDHDEARRFIRHVISSGECIIWSGARRESGYGWFFYDGKSQPAHRISHEIFKGPIPAGMLIRHSCDNPACVNPDHLIPGTHAENMADKVERGRSKTRFTYRGERHWKSKLSDSDIEGARELYAEGSSVREIAVALGVDAPALGAALKGDTRGDVGGPLYKGGARQPTPEERSRGEDHSRAKLNDASVAEIRRRVRAGEGYRELAREYGVDSTQITKAARGESWSHVTEPPVLEAPPRRGLTPERRSEIKARRASGATKQAICAEFGISEPTLNKVLAA